MDIRQVIEKSDLSIPNAIHNWNGLIPFYWRCLEKDLEHNESESCEYYASMIVSTTRWIAEATALALAPIHNPNEAIVDLDGVCFKLKRMRINQFDFVEIDKCNSLGEIDLDAGNVIWHDFNEINVVEGRKDY